MISFWFRRFQFFSEFMSTITCYLFSVCFYWLFLRDKKAREHSSIPDFWVGFLDLGNNPQKVAKSLNDIRRRRQVLNVELVQTVCNYEAQRFMHSPLEIRRWPLKGMEEEERILRGKIRILSNISCVKFLMKAQCFGVWLQYIQILLQQN